MRFDERQRLKSNSETETEEGFLSVSDGFMTLLKISRAAAVVYDTSELWTSAREYSVELMMMMMIAKDTQESKNYIKKIREKPRNNKQMPSVCARSPCLVLSRLVLAHNNE